MKNVLSAVVLVGFSLWLFDKQIWPEKPESKSTHYEFLEKNGTPAEVCFEAGVVKTGYSIDQNASEYKFWQSKESLDCWFSQKEAEAPYAEGFEWEHKGRPKACHEDYYKDRGYCQTK